MAYDYSQFADAFKSELNDLAANLIPTPGSLWGFAVMLGEDIDMLDCIAVTISTEELNNLPDDYRDEAKYIPDEWPNFHNDTFNLTAKEYRTLFQACPASENSQYTNEQIEFMTGVYDTYLAVMKDCRKLQPLASVPFVLMYTSDSARTFIARSVHALNDDAIRDEARDIYPEPIN
jgi:hypothetical protein